MGRCCRLAPTAQHQREKLEAQYLFLPLAGHRGPRHICWGFREKLRFPGMEAPRPELRVTAGGLPAFTLQSILFTIFHSIAHRQAMNRVLPQCRFTADKTEAPRCAASRRSLGPAGPVLATGCRQLPGLPREGLPREGLPCSLISEIPTGLQRPAWSAPIPLRASWLLDRKLPAAGVRLCSDHSSDPRPWAVLSTWSERRRYWENKDFLWVSLC